ncbi:hypothetical protein BSKO_08025 [Bryopsis sp. KO-2023]|nr:hypothetical protein BSKO_08025 [Bryopsis sp. KO-2023]
MNMEGEPSTDGICLRLWRDCKREAESSLHDAFVEGLGRGDLPKRAFQHYIGQDVHFLRAFAKAYALGIAKAMQMEGNSFKVLMELLHGVKEELEMHGSYAAEWEVDLTENPASPATMKYIDFLMDTGVSDKGVEVLIASMLPCCRLYNYLGCQLAKQHPGHDHPYSKWIDTYSGEEFSEVCVKKERLLEEIAHHSSYDVLLSHYRKAMELEKEFFAAQPIATNPRGIGIVVTDFDDTCSDGDTLELLLMALSGSAAKLAGGGEHADELIKQRLKAVTKISREYSKAYKALLDEYLPPMVSEIKGTAAFDMEILSSVLVPMSEFERVWNQKVVDSGVLAGGLQKAVMAGGQQIQLRKKCLPLLEKARALGLGVHVLSVNWSAEWVAAPLGPNAAISGRGETKMDENVIHVHANELMYKDGVSTGEIKRSLECADDKGRVFDELLLDEATSRGEQRGKSVYIGDSPTDLLALLAADFGIIFTGNKVLQRFVTELCIEVVPISTAPIEPGPHHPPVLYEATSWDEIGTFLLGENVVLEDDSGGVVPKVLIVAGSDSGGGAGIQADLKTCLATGSFGTTAITALTSQNTHGVHSVHTTPSQELENQMEAVLSDIGTDVVKTGMLPNPEAVDVVAKMVKKFKVKNVVVDPVMVSTSGDALAKSEVAEALKKQLIPLATVLTPNIPEASALLGGRKIDSLSDMEAAARDLHALGPKFVLLKGGHLVQHVGNLKRVIDVLFDGSNIMTLQSPVVKTGNAHGTGCTLASAIASELAQGKLVVGAIYAAREYLLKALSASTSLQIGTGVQRPFNHGYKTTDWSKGGNVEVQRSSSKHVGDALKVYAVTDPDCNARMGRSLAEAVREAIDGGATMVQIREKTASTREFTEAVRGVMKIAGNSGVPIIVNDRVDVALAENADGVHVGQEDMMGLDVRRLIGPDKILGVSVKTVEQAIQAEKDGADYVGAGAVYPTTTKDSGVIGLGVLREICQAVKIPVVSIGGINSGNAGETIDAGCAGVAVVSFVFGSESPKSAAGEVKKAVDSAIAKTNGVP